MPGKSDDIFSCLDTIDEHETQTDGHWTTAKTMLTHKNCHMLYMLIVVYASKYTFGLYYIISCMTSNNA